MSVQFSKPIQCFSNLNVCITQWLETRVSVCRFTSQTLWKADQIYIIQLAVNPMESWIALRACFPEFLCLYLSSVPPVLSSFLRLPFQASRQWSSAFWSCFATYFQDCTHIWKDRDKNNGSCDLPPWDYSSTNQKDRFLLQNFGSCRVRFPMLLLTHHRIACGLSFERLQKKMKRYFHTLCFRGSLYHFLSQN